MKHLIPFIILFLSTSCYGAEFLVMAKNNWMVDADQTNWTADQKAEAERQYKIGDIVQVFPDGACPENPCVGSPFYIIRISGLSYDTAQKYTQAITTTTINADGVSMTSMVKRRLYGVRAADLPTSVKTTLKETRAYNTTWTAVKTYITNKVTAVNE